MSGLNLSSEQYGHLVATLEGRFREMGPAGIEPTISTL